MIHHGDSLDVMAAMEPESVDAIVTDPPYGLGFMGKDWDTAGRIASVPPSAAQRIADGRDVGRLGNYPGGKGQAATSFDGPRMQAWHQQWAEAAYRVAKPSAYLLAFGGTRTVHRMTVALEDAGWIIRDMLVWAYASGFPKSKASLKPAWEPIVMARKSGPLRDLAIDSCRIVPSCRQHNWGVPLNDRAASPSCRVCGRPYDFDRGRAGELSANQRYTAGGSTDFAPLPGPRGGDPAGRWPANVILTDPIFDGGVEGVVGGGEQSGGGNPPRRLTEDRTTYGAFAQGQETGLLPTDTSGTYSRFFLIPKADRADREPVLGGLPKTVVNITEGHGRGAVNTSKGDGTGIRENRPRANSHPTVKPTDLMRHLVRLVTPPGGTVLDPFLGSGTTGIAAELEGFPWIGIEREAEYVAIAEARLNGVQKGFGLSA